MVLFGFRELTQPDQARQLLAWSVRRHWGLAPLPELTLWERGKPYFSHLPRRQFNLSHSGTLALCALSDRPVGVDIQVVRRAWRDLARGKDVSKYGFVARFQAALCKLLPHSFVMTYWMHQQKLP